MNPAAQWTKAKRFSLILAMMVISFGSCTPHDHDYLVYVGTYTGKGSDGIYVYRFNSANGALTPIGLAAKSIHPSFLVPDERGEFLYAVNEADTFHSEVTHEATGAISVFRVNRESGALTLLQQISSEGTAPCHVSLDASGRFLFVANYSGGSAAIFPIAGDGRLGAYTQFIQGAGSSVHPQRQTQAHAHFIEATPDNRFLMIADLGRDLVLAGRFENGQLNLQQPAVLAPGSGPRHFVFNPSGKSMYVLNELSSTISAFSYDSASGVLTPLSTVSSLPDDFTGANTAAEITTVNGKFLYVSNRGHDSIGLFNIDPQHEHPVAVEWVSSGGTSPRHIEIDPGGRWLLAANQHSGNLSLFSIDPSTGQLTPSGESQPLSAPVCVRFIPVH